MQQRRAVPVTVIVPVHNRAQLIEETLASVSGQQPARPAQIIVVDDASDDDGADRAEAAGATVVRLAANVGPGGARNVALEHATQPWSAFLDSDDLWAPDHLATLFSVVRSTTPSLSLVTSSAVTILGGKVRVIGNPYRRPRFLASADALLCPENVVATSACMIKTEVALDAGGFGSDWLAEDLDLWLRVLDRGPGWALPNITVRYGRTVEDDGRSRASADSSAMRQTARSVVGRHTGLRERSSKGLAACTEWDALRLALQHHEGRASIRSLCRLVRLGAWPELAHMIVQRRACRTRWHDQQSAVRALIGRAAG